MGRRAAPYPQSIHRDLTPCMHGMGQCVLHRIKDIRKGTIGAWPMVPLCARAGSYPATTA